MSTQRMPDNDILLSLKHATAAGSVKWKALREDEYGTVVCEVRIRIGWAWAYRASDDIAIDRQAITLTVGRARKYYVWHTAGASLLSEILGLAELRWDEHFRRICRMTFASRALRAGTKSMVRLPKHTYGSRYLRFARDMLMLTEQGLLHWRRSRGAQFTISCQAPGIEGTYWMEYIYTLGNPRHIQIPFIHLHGPGVIVTFAAGTEGMYVCEQILSIASPRFAKELAAREKSFAKLAASLAELKPARKRAQKTWTTHSNR